MRLLTATTFAVSALACGTVAEAQTAPAATVTIDENGNGTGQSASGQSNLSSSMLTDPGPGGISSVLTYQLPKGIIVNPGDVFLQDLFNGSLATLDLIRFNPATATAAASIAFYSDNIGGADALGDTTSPPSAFYTNSVTLPEIGAEDVLNGATYTPTANQPGFVRGFNVTYRFISDGSAVPEPATWAMMLLGFGAIGLTVRRRRRQVLAPIA